MVKPGIYRHFKGGVYEVLFTAQNSESGESMVIYRSVAEPQKLWARPERMWSEHVERDSYSGERFTPISQTENNDWKRR